MTGVVVVVEVEVEVKVEVEAAKGGVAVARSVSKEVVAVCKLVVEAVKGEVERSDTDVVNEAVDVEEERPW